MVYLLDALCIKESSGRLVEFCPSKATITLAREEDCDQSFYEEYNNNNNVFLPEVSNGACSCNAHTTVYDTNASRPIMRGANEVQYTTNCQRYLIMSNNYLTNNFSSNHLYLIVVICLMMAMHIKCIIV